MPIAATITNFIRVKSINQTNIRFFVTLSVTGVKIVVVIN